MKNTVHHSIKNAPKRTVQTVRTALALLFCSLLCCLCALPAFAAEAGTGYAQTLPLVTDAASILSGDEVASLQRTAEGITNQYRCSVYIITVDDLNNYTNSGSVETCAEEIRESYALGYGGANGNCIVLLLAMRQREYDLMAHGDIGNTAFTDYGKEVLADRFLDDFGEDNWYTGFRDYLTGCSSMLEAAAAGTPVDVDNSVSLPPPPLWTGFVASLLIGLVVALIICMIIRGSMKSVHQQTQAGNYIRQNGVNFTCRQDRFTHSTEVRVYDPPTKQSSGGGTTINSSGSSHSSGRF